MFTLKQLIGSSLFGFVLAGAALAQDQRAPIDTPREPVPVAAAPLVTATATAKRVRFVSPGTVVQLRLEVFNEAGQKLFDTEQRGGNVLDWPLQDGAGERLPAGSYACVLTIKSLSGRISQRVGLVSVNDEKTAIEAAGAGELSQLSMAQQQAIGPVASPVEGSAGFTVLQQSEAEAITAVTHDGTKGQVSRTLGPLSFRVGDVFSGKDKEQMRLTEDGRLGIGTSDPQAKLDVAGTIRAERVVITKPGQPGKAGSDNQISASDNAQAVDPEQPLATGSGSQGRIAKWTDNAGTLGDSVITESAGGNVGVGNTNPQSLLQVGPNPGYGTTTGLLITNNLTGTQYDRGFQLAPRQTASPLTNSILMYALPTVNPGVTVPSQYGLFVDGRQGTGSISSYAAIATGQGASLGATNNTHLLLGNLAIPSGNYAIYDNTNYKSFFKGKVGIGTASPNYPLTASGRGTFFPFAAAEFSNDYVDTGIILNNKAASERAWTLVSSGTGSGLGVGTFSITDLNANQTRFIINSSGNVGIGTITPGTAKLAVNGATDATQYNIASNRVLGNPGLQNIFAGVEAGLNNTGNFNSFVGFGAGRVNTGGANSFFGTSAGLMNLAGANNAFFGVDAGRVNTGGGGNSFFGTDAGDNNGGGANNTFVGRSAGSANTSGISNTVIGAFANVAHPDLTNATAIGSNATVSASNTMVLGTSDVTVRVPGTLVVGNISPANVPGIEFEQFKCFGCGGREVGSGDGSTFDVTLRSVNVPAAGFLFITAHAEFDFTSGDLVAGSNLVATLELVGASTLTAVSGSSNEGKRLTLNLSWVEPVAAAGTVELKTVSRAMSFNSSVFLYKVRSHGLHVIYVPRRLN